jgi:predicted nucleic-acid-binding protein
MYVEADFLLALIKEDDWLGERAAEIYDEHREELWTSHYALVELLLVAYREDRNTERVVANASRVVEVLLAAFDPPTIDGGVDVPRPEFVLLTSAPVEQRGR